MDANRRARGLAAPLARLALASCLAAVTGCDSVSSDAVTRCNQQLVLPGAVKTDILFVVDDSGSMDGAQANLQANFQAFVDRLAASPVKNDFQIGVTTTSVDTYYQGTFPDTFWNPYTPTDTCTAPPYPTSATYPKGALVSVTPTGNGDQLHRVQSVTQPPRILPAGSPTLVADFVANVDVGVCGSGKEAGLEAARLAIQAAVPGGANDRFLRPGARLAVVIVSDDDDCSDPLHQGTSREPTACTSYPVQSYVDYFTGPLGGETRPVIVGAIVAVDPVTLQPSACLEPSGNAAEHGAVRYRAFADAFGANALVDSVCNPSFHDTLVKLAGLIDPGQVMPLQGVPSDWRLLVVSVVKADGTRVSCTVGDGTGGTADVVYLPPAGSDPARLQFGGACTLQLGDSVDVRTACAS